MAYEILPYDREKAVEYAHKWAYRRNPLYYDYHDIGGDCTNFISQCVLEGSSKIMNHKPVFGWYYYNGNNKSPSWTGVVPFHQFITRNEGVGPYAKEVPMDEMMPGDVIQLKFGLPRFGHSLLVVEVGENPTPANILIATHTYDSDDRALITYLYSSLRCLHIEGVRKSV